MPHRAHFVLSHRLQLEFSTVPHQVQLFTFIGRGLYLILANDTPQSVSVRRFGECYPAECTATRPNVYNMFMPH